jgi:phosphopantetheinyl transferase
MEHDSASGRGVDGAALAADDLRAAAARTLRSTPGLAEIVVWTASLPGVVAIARGSEGVLSAAERAEVDGRPAGRVRDAFVARRILRRTLVAAHLGCGLSEVEIDTRCERCGDPRHGRPTVTGPGRGLHLSTSSTGDLLAVAMAPFPVGLDVERGERFDERTASDVDRATDGGWTAVSRAVPEGASPVHVWTALEAFCKGIGSGIVASAREMEEALDRWSFIWWAPDAGSVGCVAADRPVATLSTLVAACGPPGVAAPTPPGATT